MTPGSVCTSISLERRPLRQGEVADLRLGELNVRERLRRQGAHTVLDLVARKPEGRRRPLVELLGVLAHGLLAVSTDVAEDPLDCLANLQAVLGFDRGRLAALDLTNQGNPVLPRESVMLGMVARHENVSGDPPQQKTRYLSAVLRDTDIPDGADARDTSLDDIARAQEAAVVHAVAGR